MSDDLLARRPGGPNPNEQTLATGANPQDAPGAKRRSRAGGQAQKIQAAYKKRVRDKARTQQFKDANPSSGTIKRTDKASFKSTDGIDASADPSRKELDQASVKRHTSSAYDHAPELLRRVASDPNQGPVLPPPDRPHLKPTPDNIRTVLASIASRRPGGTLTPDSTPASVSPDKARAQVEGREPYAAHDLTPEQLNRIDAGLRKIVQNSLSAFRRAQAADASPQAGSSSQIARAEAAPARTQNTAAQIRSTTLRLGAAGPSAPVARFAAASATPSLLAGLGGVAGLAGSTSSQTPNDGTSQQVSGLVESGPMALIAQPPNQPVQDDTAPPPLVAGQAPRDGDDKTAFDKLLDKDPLMHKTLADFQRQANTYVGWTAFLVQMQKDMQRYLMEQTFGLQLATKFASQANIAAVTSQVLQQEAMIKWEQFSAGLALARSILGTQDKMMEGPLSRFANMSPTSTADNLDINTGYGTNHGQGGIHDAAISHFIGEAMGLASRPTNPTGAYKVEASEAGHTPEQMAHIRAQRADEARRRPVNEQIIGSVYTDHLAPTSAVGAAPTDDLARIQPIKRYILSSDEIKALPPMAQKEYDAHLRQSQRRVRYNDLATLYSLHQIESYRLTALSERLNREAQTIGRIDPQRAEALRDRAGVAQHHARLLGLEAKERLDELDQHARMLGVENVFGDFRRQYTYTDKTRQSLIEKRHGEGLNEEERITLAQLNQRCVVWGDLLDRYTYAPSDNRGNRYNPGDQSTVAPVHAILNERSDSAEIARIEQKVAQSGFGSLSSDEKKMLGNQTSMERLEMDRRVGNVPAILAARLRILRLERANPTGAAGDALPRVMPGDEAIARRADGGYLMQYLKDREDFYFGQLKLPRPPPEDAASLTAIFDNPGYKSVFQEGPAAASMRLEYAHMGRLRQNLMENELRDVPETRMGLGTRLRTEDWVKQAIDVEARLPGDRQDSKNNAIAHDKRVDWLDEDAVNAHLEKQADAIAATQAGRSYRNDFFETLNKWANGLQNIDFGDLFQREAQSVEKTMGELGSDMYQAYSECLDSINEIRNIFWPAVEQAVQYQSFRGQ